MPIILFAILLFLTGCVNRQAVADSSASIWEAAAAIEQGADPEEPLKAIQAQSRAIIRAVGYTYSPADHKEAP